MDDVSSSSGSGDSCNKEKKKKKKNNNNKKKKTQGNTTATKGPVVALESESEESDTKGQYTIKVISVLAAGWNGARQ